MILGQIGAHAFNPRFAAGLRHEAASISCGHILGIRKGPFSPRISLRDQSKLKHIIDIVILPPHNFFFRDRVSLCSPGCPATHFVDQAVLELRNPPASASHVLGIKECTTTPGSCSVFLTEAYGL